MSRHLSTSRRPGLAATAVDLFCGAGGSSLILHGAGIFMTAALSAAEPPPALPVTFQAQLVQQHVAAGWDAGWASFQVNGNELRFGMFVDEAVGHFCGVVLHTDSRQATVQTGAGTVVTLPLCGPALVPATEAPGLVGCDGFRTGRYYMGSIPLNETLLRELGTGQGRLLIHLPGQPDSGGFWNVPPPVLGGLHLVPGGDVAEALAALPRIPRSLTSLVGSGPVHFPPDFWSEYPVDVDGDGQADLQLKAITLCTMSIPSSCTSMFNVSSHGEHQLLVQEGVITVLSAGSRIGPEAPAETTWAGPGQASLTTLGWGGCARPWSGELGRVGEGYLAIKLRRAGRDHYGWVRMRLPQPVSRLPTIPLPPFPPPPGGLDVQAAWEPVPPVELPLTGLREFSPVIEDWAWEPSPDTPIPAGARPFPVRLVSGGMRRADHLRVHFISEPGRSYAVQFKPELAARGWETLGGLWIAGASQTALDLPLSGTLGFYRVIEAD